jgi:hypothetical protein
VIIPQTSEGREGEEEKYVWRESKIVRYSEKKKCREGKIKTGAEGR